MHTGTRRRRACCLPRSLMAPASTGCDQALRSSATACSPMTSLGSYDGLLDTVVPCAQIQRRCNKLCELFTTEASQAGSGLRSQGTNTLTADRTLEPLCGLSPTDHVHTTFICRLPSAISTQGDQLCWRDELSTLDFANSTPHTHYPGWLAEGLRTLVARRRPAHLLKPGVANGQHLCLIQRRQVQRPAPHQRTRP